MKGTLTYLKENWFTIAIIVLFIIVIRVGGVNNRENRREIRALSDSIAQMDREYLLMGERVSAMQDTASAAINEANLYRDSLENTRIKMNTDSTRYENEINNLTGIPTDTLYIDITGWLDSLPF